MSDALLSEISKKLSDIHAVLKSGGGSSAGAVNPKPTGGPKPDANAIASDTTKTAAQKKEAADKAIAAAKAKKEAEAKAATANAPAAGTKAKGGKHTIEQVRDIIRKVANDVDKQSAKDILKDDGNGVQKVVELKPEFYDAVYEACEVLLGGEATGAAPAAEEEDDFA